MSVKAPPVCGPIPVSGIRICAKMLIGADRFSLPC